MRHKTLQTLRGASKVTPKVEWEFVLHNARLYDRMGCDLLGLDLGMLSPFLAAWQRNEFADYSQSPKLGVLCTCYDGCCRIGRS
jgi:hypothetical protein